MIYVLNETGERESRTFRASAPPPVQPSQLRRQSPVTLYWIVHVGSSRIPYSMDTVSVLYLHSCRPMYATATRVPTLPRQVQSNDKLALSPSAPCSVAGLNETVNQSTSFLTTAVWTLEDDAQNCLLFHFSFPDRTRECGTCHAGRLCLRSRWHKLRGGGEEA